MRRKIRLGPIQDEQSRGRAISNPSAHVPEVSSFFSVQTQQLFRDNNRRTLKDPFSQSNVCVLLAHAIHRELPLSRKNHGRAVSSLVQKKPSTLSNCRREPHLRITLFPSTKPGARALVDEHSGDTALSPHMSCFDELRLGRSWLSQELSPSMCDKRA